MRGLLLLTFVALSYGQDCQPTEFLCSESGVCIPQAKVCDGFSDCTSGTDEQNCPSTTTTECPGFVCPITRECIPPDWICDGYDDCGDNSDERDCPCDGFVCENGECIPSWWECDEVSDCPGGEDEQNCPRECADDEFACNSTGRCIPGNWECDGMNDCDDGSDEIGCPCDGFLCPVSGRCLPPARVCDGQDDCGNGEDETEEACACLDEEIRCPSPPDSNAPGKCIPPEFICDEDGIWDCPDGFDEANCTEVVNRPRHKDGVLRIQGIKTRRSKEQQLTLKRGITCKKETLFAFNRLKPRSAKSAKK